MLNRFSFLVLPALLFSSAHADQPTCSGVHVWYSMTNDAKVNWSVQISRIYENNISFVDEQCQEIVLSDKIEITPAQTRYVGMKVDVQRGFSATYSFFGVQTGTTASVMAMIPQKIPACGFFVAPYGPGQMDRMDWQLNNSNCYSDQYGTVMHFR